MGTVLVGFTGSECAGVPEAGGFGAIVVADDDGGCEDIDTDTAARAGEIVRLDKAGWDPDPDVVAVATTVVMTVVITTAAEAGAGAGAWPALALTELDDALEDVLKDTLEDVDAGTSSSPAT